MRAKEQQRPMRKVNQIEDSFIKRCKENPNENSTKVYFKTRQACKTCS